MPLSTSITIILFCALVAAAISAAKAAFQIATFEPLKMADFHSDHAFYHERGYANSFNRHNPPAKFAAPSPYQVYLANKLADERAERIVWDFFMKLLANFLLYTALGFCGWKVATNFRACLSLLVRLATAISRAFTQNAIALQVRQDFGETVARTGQFLRHSYADFFASPTITSVSIARQRLINWIARHKFLLIVAPVALHLLASTIRSQMQQSTEVFLTWEQLRHLDQPLEIPTWLVEPRRSGDSSSHFWPAEQLIDETVRVIDDDLRLIEHMDDDHDTPSHASHVTDDTSAGSARPISVTTTAAGPLFTATEEGEEEVVPAENRLAVEGMTFCQHCRQRHCCEVYH